MNKKAIAILGAIFILIVGTLGFLIYSKSLSKKPAATTAVATPPLSTSTPQTAASPTPIPAGTAGSITQLSSAQVVSPVLFYNGGGITYFDNQGNLYQAAFNTSTPGSLELSAPSQLDIPSKAGLAGALWPQQGDDFIAEISSGSQSSFSVYDSQSGAYVNFPPQVEDLAWLPSGNQLVEVWVSNNQAALFKVNDDGKNFQQIAPLYKLDDAIAVSPDGQTVAFYEQQPGSALEVPIYGVSSDGKTFKTFVGSGQNSGVLWSPDSQKFLFAKKDPVTQAYQLWYYNVQTGETTSLGLDTTVDKAVWAADSQTVYAAVPQSGSATQSSLSTDVFYQINTQTGSQQPFPAPATAVDGRDLFLSQDGTELFFRNAQDGGLYYMGLTQPQ